MKIVKYSALVLVALFIIIMLIGLLSGERGATSTEGPTEAPCTVQQRPEVISGMNPADLYLSLEDRGYTTSKEFGSQGITWVCSSSDEAVSYAVTISGKSATSVDLVKATVVSLDGGSIAPAQHVLAFVASAPYTGAEPQRAKDWVLEHFDQDGATVTIGSATLTIKAASPQSKMLVMEPA